MLSLQLCSCRAKHKTSGRLTLTYVLKNIKITKTKNERGIIPIEKQNTKETWQLNTRYEPGLDPGPEGTIIKDFTKNIAIM